MASEIVSPRRARVRVTIYRNGDNQGAKLLSFDPTATTFAQLLELAAQKLEPATPFTRVFVDNGAEADNINDFISGDQLFFSSGEDFKKMAENTTSVASVTVPTGAGGDTKSTASEADSEERRQFLSQIAASVTSAAASLYESSSQYAKANGPSVVRVTLERVEDRVRPIAANMLPHLMRVTSWADEKLDGVYAKLETKSNEFLASPLAARVNENLVMPLKEMVIEPSTAFYNTAVDKFHQLDINRDGKVAVETFVSGLKEQLGSAWNEKLVEPAKAFHTAAVKQLQANKTLQQTRELLDKTWNDVVVANFKARVTGPAEAFYQMALNSYMSLKASGNGQVTFQDFHVALRAALGRFWSTHLEGPAQHLYDQFSAVAQNTKDAATSLLGGGPSQTPQ